MQQQFDWYLFWIIFIVKSWFRHFTIKTIVPKIILGKGGSSGEKWRLLEWVRQKWRKMTKGVGKPRWRHLWTLPNDYWQSQYFKEVVSYYKLINTANIDTKTNFTGNWETNLKKKASTLRNTTGLGTFSHAEDQVLRSIIWREELVLQNYLGNIEETSKFGWA